MSVVRSPIAVLWWAQRPPCAAASSLSSSVRAFTSTKILLAPVHANRSQRHHKRSGLKPLQDGTYSSVHDRASARPERRTSHPPPVPHTRGDNGRTSPASATASFVKEDLAKDAAQQQQQHRGIFQSQHIKLFPVRAAIDIGTGGAISLCIGRVDAHVGAVQKLMYQTQLPLYLEKLQQASHDSPVSTFALSERTIDDITNKMRVLHGVLRRNAFEGLSERAAVLSWPLCEATNARALADALTREFKVDVRVLGKTFNVSWPPSVLAAHAAAMTTSLQNDDRSLEDQKSAKMISKPRSKKGDTLKDLLQRNSSNTNSSNSSNTTTTSHEHERVDPRAQVDTLAFLAHAAVSQCVAPQRLIVLSEDPQRGLRLLGLGTSPAVDVADLLEAADNADAVAKLQHVAFGGEKEAASDDGFVSPGSLQQQQQHHSPYQPHFEKGESAALLPREDAHDGLRVLAHTLPVDVATAHRHCITTIQRRPAEAYGLHTSSPNPLLPDEFAQLRGLLTDSLRHDLPRWVCRKSQLGGMFVGTSFNGGLLNIAARVAQQTSISLDHLEVHAQHHFCGLTDVLLAENFPNPLLVLPSAALAAAVLRAMESPRITYVPEVNVAAALLVQAPLWLASRSAEVRRRLSQDVFYAAHTSAQRGRTFDRPHRKDNPTAAPDATWVQGERWNALSYEESLKGT